jgi:hypothetical protein
MTTIKPGIITRTEFNTFMIVAAIVFGIFMAGVLGGVWLERQALEQVLESDDHIIYLHHPTIEGGYLS